MILNQLESGVLRSARICELGTTWHELAVYFQFMNRMWAYHQIFILSYMAIGFVRKTTSRLHWIRSWYPACQTRGSGHPPLLIWSSHVVMNSWFLNVVVRCQHFAFLVAWRKSNRDPYPCAAVLTRDSKRAVGSTAKWMLRIKCFGGLLEHWGIYEDRRKLGP